eukprot:snap_masked-scaffold_11-processed-gene-12.54-mRNA-1 protein AED:1.00 eAED:1.00 QI:0/-1/0/0/-1/1/1/0/99
MGPKKIRTLRQWTELERIVLVGNIFDSLFINPYLTKRSWKEITRKFHADCFLFEVNENTEREQSAIERYFKTLKVENRQRNGELFMDLFQKWKRMQVEF